MKEPIKINTVDFKITKLFINPKGEVSFSYIVNVIDATNLDDNKIKVTYPKATDINDKYAIGSFDTQAYDPTLLKVEGGSVIDRPVWVDCEGNYGCNETGDTENNMAYAEYISHVCDMYNIFEEDYLVEDANYKTRDYDTDEDGTDIYARALFNGNILRLNKTFITRVQEIKQQL